MDEIINKYLNEKSKMDKCPKCGWVGYCWDECNMIKDKSKKYWVFECPKCGGVIRKLGSRFESMHKYE